MEQVIHPIIKYSLSILTKSSWAVGVVISIYVIYLFKNEVIQPFYFYFERKDKNINIYTNLLDSGRLSQETNCFLIEALEKEAFMRNYGIRAEKPMRSALIRFYQRNEENITWQNLKRAYPYLQIKHGEIAININKFDIWWNRIIKLLSYIILVIFIIYLVLFLFIIFFTNWNWIYFIILLSTFLCLEIFGLFLLDSTRPFKIAQKIEKILAIGAYMDVLQFWLGAYPLEESAMLRMRPQWFRKSDELDAEIRTRFGATIEAALAGDLDDWADTPEGRLALLIVLDQFTRNAFRGQPKSFAGDARALALAQRGIVLGHDQQVPPLARTFYYLPLEHAEDMATQQHSVALFQRLADGATPALQAVLADALDYAHKHADVIQRFGRFPHRNTILGRENTADEAAYLAQPGAGF